MRSRSSREHGAVPSRSRIVIVVCTDWSASSRIKMAEVHVFAGAIVVIERIAVGRGLAQLKRFQLRESYLKEVVSSLESSIRESSA